MMIPFIERKTNMKRKTIAQIIKILENKGHVVTAKKRSNGGYYITSIDQQRFKNSRGNAQARQMTGNFLSRAQLKQRRANARNLRVKPLPKSVLKQLEKTRKAMKQRKVPSTIKMKNARKGYARYGRKELIKKLKSQERYALGWAYVDNVKWFIGRLLELGRFFDYDFNNIVIQLQANINNIKDQTLMDMYDIIYDCEHLNITPRECERRLQAIIDSEII